MTDSTITPAEMAMLRQRFPEGKRCPMCGELLPVEGFAINRKRNKSGRTSVTLQGYCKTCHNLKRHTYPVRVREEIVIPKSVIPSLKVGRSDRIIDTGRTWLGVSGGDGNAKPVHYIGPCVARWGRNWGIKTSTGIRCFTPSTLVGLDVGEVGKSA